MTPAASVTLIDASLYIFRAWFSVQAPMQDKDGNPTNAVYGFTGFLLSLLDQERPEYIAAAFDESLQTSFRNEIYPPYKANREPAPVELKRQFMHCQAIAEALGIDTFSDQRFEADDFIGTLAHRKKSAGHRIQVVSADKDLAQVIGPDDVFWDFANNRRMDLDGVVDRFGVTPDQIADYLALTGDSVDNIPGVRGIGPKAAAALMSHFGTLEGILARADEIDFLSLRGAKSIGRKIREQSDEALLARRLTGLSLEAPIPDPEPSLRWARPDLDALFELFDYLDMGDMTRRRCERLASVWDDRGLD